MSYPNGQYPDSALRDTVIGGRLVPAASRDADSMALAFASHFYRSLTATDTYRTIEAQRRLAVEKPNLAAEPGTSVHGFGEAVDFASNVPNASSVEHRWMEENGGRYGWVNPAWAKVASRFEPWHYEHVRRARVRHAINRPRGSSIGLGSSGPEVLRLQEDLNRVYRGHGIRITEDGRYGMGTYALVRRFQRARGILLKTGVVGKLTKSAVAAAVRQL